MSQLYVCKEYETPYEEGYRVITTLEEHDSKVRAEIIDEFVRWAYLYGVDFSFAGRIKEDGTSDVVDRLNAIKSRFYKQMKEKKNDNT